MVGALATTGTIFLGHHALWMAERDAWLAFTAGTVAAVAVAGLVAGLGVHFPSLTLAGAGRLTLGRVLGRFLGSGVGLLYALYFLLAAILSLVTVAGVMLSLVAIPVNNYTLLFPLFERGFQPFVVLKIPLFLYAAMVEAADVFSVRHYRGLLLPVGAVFAILPAFIGAEQVEEFLVGVYPVLGLVMGIGLPALLVAVAAIRKTRSETVGEGRVG